MRRDAEPTCDCHSNEDITVAGTTLAGLVFGVLVRISVRFRARQSQNRTLKFFHNHNSTTQEAFLKIKARFLYKCSVAR